MHYDLRFFLVVLLPLLGGCAIFPPSRSALVGTHTASIGFNEGTSVVLKADGTYERSVSLFYWSPLVIPAPEGNQEINGWTNTETGTWEIFDRIVRLKADERQIENPTSRKDISGTFVPTRSLTNSLPVGCSSIPRSRVR